MEMSEKLREIKELGEDDNNVVRDAIDVDQEMKIWPF